MRGAIIFIYFSFFYTSINAQTLVVLGTTQDAGKPQLGCQKSCCNNMKDRFFVSSLGVTDTKNKKNYF
jgi:pyrroloquinoline quinone biosynthesis protein B